MLQGGKRVWGVGTRSEGLLEAFGIAGSPFGEPADAAFAQVHDADDREDPDDQTDQNQKSVHLCPFRVRDRVREPGARACCAGATGSGKSSGSGRAMALAMLAGGYGGLVLTAKPDEVDVWKRYCALTGRSDDLIVVRPGGPWSFNPLEHEVIRAGKGAGLCENVVAMFSAILELADRGGGGGGGASGGRDDEGYWWRALKQLIRNFTELLIQGTGTVSFDDLYRVVISAPTSPEQKASAEWQERSICFRMLKNADRREKTAAKKRDLELVADYILVEFPALSEKTRSIIVSTFTSMIDVMQRSPLRELFGQQSTFSPVSRAGPGSSSSTAASARTTPTWLPGSWASPRRVRVRAGSPSRWNWNSTRHASPVSAPAGHSTRASSTPSCSEAAGLSVPPARPGCT